MTQLMKQRPWAVWCLFLAGAITGGIASSLMEPQHVWADPVVINGQKFEDILALTQGMSRDDSGAFVFSAPVKIQLLDESETAPALAVVGRVSIDPLMIDENPDGPLLSVQGNVNIDPFMLDPIHPALVVVGPSLFTGDAGQDTPLVSLDPIMLHPGKPEFLVRGPSLFTGDAGPETPLVSVDPIMLHPSVPVMVIDGGNGAVTSIDPANIHLSHPEGATRLGWNLVELLGTAGKTTVRPDGIELLDELATTNIFPDGIELLDEAAMASTSVHPYGIELLHPAADGPFRLGVAEDGSYLDMGPGPGVFRVNGPAYATDFIDTDEVISPF